MNKYIGLALVVFAVLTVSCSNQEHDSKRRLEEARFAIITEVLSQPGDEKGEFVVLLSMKYGLDIDLTSKIIEDFAHERWNQKVSLLLEAKTIEEFEQLRAELEEPSTEERINKFSDESMIDKSLIAALLIDYEIWHEASQ